MQAVRYRVLLEHFNILSQNESSGDEPYLWIFHVRIDGRNVNLANPERSSVHVHSPPGSHGNLGPGSRGMKRTDTPISIPVKIGRYEGELDPTGIPSALAPLCTMGVIIVGLEEDAAPSSGKVEEARRFLARSIRDQLSAAVRRLVREGRFDQSAAGTLQAAVSVQTLRDGIEDIMKGEIVRNLVLGAFLFPPLLAAADVDDFVGHSVEGPYDLPALLASAGSTIPVRALLSNAANNHREGMYHVTGRIEVLEPRAPVQIGAALWTPPRASLARPRHHLVLVGRSPADGGFYRSRSEDAGASWGPFRRIGAGVFRSGPAVAATRRGETIHSFGQGNDRTFWRAASSDGGNAWSPAWARVAEHAYEGPPALAVSEDGTVLHAVGWWRNGRYFVATSTNGGATFSSWEAVGDGVFTSAPAACTSADGRVIHLFGRGRDERIWHARSRDRGRPGSWEVAWRPVLDRRFLSSPAAACDASGSRVVVLARGTLPGFWMTTSTDRGNGWVRWASSRFPGRGFISSPAVALTSDGATLHAFGVGRDLRAYTLRTAFDGSDFKGNWTRVGPNNGFY